MTPLALASVLAFEHLRWNQRGAKEQAIRDVFGMTATRYYQALLVIIDLPEALVLAPVTVNRLRRRLCA